MLTTVQAATHISAIAIGFLAVNLPVAQTNAQQLDYTWRNKFAVSQAQSTTADSFNFEEISVGDETSWNFSSKDETASLRDEIQQLGEYNISDTDNFNVKLIQENRTWANKGDRPYYYIENRIAPYYSVETQIYGY